MTITVDTDLKMIDVAGNIDLTLLANFLRNYSYFFHGYSLLIDEELTSNVFEYLVTDGDNVSVTSKGGIINEFQNY